MRSGETDEAVTVDEPLSGSSEGVWERRLATEEIWTWTFLTVREDFTCWK